MALKDVRTAKGWSVPELGERSGVNKQMISFYENGTKDINGAKLKTLLALADTLDCKLSDLITDPETASLLKRRKM